MRTMPETAAITAHITSPSCAIWPLISCPRNPPRVPCVSKSNGPVGRTLTSQSSSPKSEMRLPWVLLRLGMAQGRDLDLSRLDTFLKVGHVRPGRGGSHRRNGSRLQRRQFVQPPLDPLD